MKVQMKTTVKSGSIIAISGHIYSGDDIPPFVKKLVDAKSEHVLVIDDDAIEDGIVNEDPENEVKDGFEHEGNEDDGDPENEDPEKGDTEPTKPLRKAVKGK